MDLSKLNSIDSSVYAVIGLNRSLIENLPYVKENRIFDLVKEAINFGFQDETNINGARQQIV